MNAIRTTEPIPGRHDEGAVDTASATSRGRWWPRVLTVVLVAVVAGVVAAWLTPRGPVSAAQALTSMVLAVLVGLVCGRVLASRWSLLLTPVVFVVAFELVRAGAVGVTVDAIRLDSFIGAIAFVAGRGVHGLLVLLPMVLGARYGVELAARRRLDLGSRMRGTGWAVTAALSLVVLLVGALVARPASTAPVVGADGRPVDGSIAELVTVRVDGQDQSVMLRGRNVRSPVLLHLAGGPGGTDIGAMRLDDSLERDFVVATWDQPGTGKSYAAIDPVESMTLERVVSDTVAVTEYLRERFDQDRIYLTGQSWGTIPGVLAVQQHPERYHAFVGTGQMVDIAETDRIFYDETLAWARERGDDALVTELLEMGPPPYEDLLRYTTIIGSEREIYSYPEFDGRTEMPATIVTPENSFMDVVNAARGLVDTYALLYPQLQQLNFRASVPALDVPVYLVMGQHEARGRAEPARTWFDALDAPHKEWVELPDSSHRASFEQPGLYAELMVRVQEETSGR